MSGLLQPRHGKSTGAHPKGPSRLSGALESSVVGYWKGQALRSTSIRKLQGVPVPYLERRLTGSEKENRRSLVLVYHRMDT